MTNKSDKTQAGDAELTEEDLDQVQGGSDYDTFGIIRTEARTTATSDESKSSGVVYTKGWTNTQETKT